eukprot:1658595-Pyramimonas_sp.AAC.1
MHTDARRAWAAARGRRQRRGLRSARRRSAGWRRREMSPGVRGEPLGWPTARAGDATVEGNSYCE